MSHPHTIYIISGPLGSGKTSVSMEIANAFKRDHVIIEGDTLLHSLSEIDNLSWEDKLQVTWENIASITRNYLKRDLNVIIDFVVEEELEWFCKKVSDLNTTIKYAVLITNKETLLNRLTQRGETQFLNRSLVLLDKLNNQSNNQYIIDTTHKTVAEIADDIIKKDEFKLLS